MSRATIQVLRRLAQKHGVARVADDAKRDKVQTMAIAVLEAVEKARVDQEEANRKVVFWPQPNAHFCVRCVPFVLDHKCESGGLVSAKCILL